MLSQSTRPPSSSTHFCYLLVGKRRRIVRRKTIINIQTSSRTNKSLYLRHRLKNGMRTKTKNRIIVAWVLLIALMPLFIVKSIHYHSEKKMISCHSEKGSAQLPADECVVCQFTLSPFTQGETIQIHCLIPVFSYKPVYRVDKPIHRPIYSPYLRAPPICQAI